MRHVLAALLSLGIVTPAAAFDPNTFEALVIIEPDEEGFIVIGRSVARHLKPGWHNKLPFIEQLAVITTTADRYGSTEVYRRFPDGSECSVSLDLTYVISDARRAYDWRIARGLDSTQQQGLFKIPRDDYTEAAGRAEDTLADFLDTLSPRQAACGAIEAWDRFDPAGLRDQVNADGTEIRDTEIYRYCTFAEAIACPQVPPISRSFSSSAQDNSRHR